MRVIKQNARIQKIFLFSSLWRIAEIEIILLKIGNFSKNYKIMVSHKIMF